MERKVPTSGNNHVQLLTDLLAGKWTVSVIHTLRQGTMRYSAIEKVLPDITQRALTIALRTLERNGMVERRVCPTVPQQVEYKLTPLGLELLNLSELLSDWAEKHEAEIKRAQKTYARHVKDNTPLL